MRFTRQIPIASLILSILVLWQPTLADSRSDLPWNREEKTPSLWEKNKCPGGFSPSFRLGGEINNPTTYNLQNLRNLRDALKSQNPALVTEITVSFQTSSPTNRNILWSPPMGID